jgi:hypothetical protein
MKIWHPLEFLSSLKNVSGWVGLRRGWYRFHWFPYKTVAYIILYKKTYNRLNEGIKIASTSQYAYLTTDSTESGTAQPQLVIFNRSIWNTKQLSSKEHCLGSFLSTAIILINY